MNIHSIADSNKTHKLWKCRTESSSSDWKEDIEERRDTINLRATIDTQATHIHFDPTPVLQTREMYAPSPKTSTERKQDL